MDVVRVAPESVRKVNFLCVQAVVREMTIKGGVVFWRVMNPAHGFGVFVT